MTNYPKLSAEDNSAGADIVLPPLPEGLKEIAYFAGQPQDVFGRREMQEYARAAVELDRQQAMPADEWLRQLDALVDAHEDERKKGTAAGRVKARAAIKAHARRRIASTTDAQDVEECAATGAGCSYGGHGPNGEKQCRYCGESPQPSTSAPEEPK